METATETADNGKVMTDSEASLRHARKVLSALASDREQSDTMRGLARKARQSLNNVIVEISGE